jgi:hypothetical protein
MKDWLWSAEADESREECERDDWLLIHSDALCAHALRQILCAIRLPLYKRLLELAT